MRNFRDLVEIAGSAGQEIGVSDWLQIDQKRIDLFAEATDDHQWIHVDSERAATGPFGATIAHGYLTLSLLASLMRSVYRVEEARMGVNYGLNRVRFPSPVPVGARIRARVTLKAVDDIQGGIQATWSIVVEIDGSDKPACVAESVSRLYK